jgi:hypothetical protein
MEGVHLHSFDIFLSQLSVHFGLDSWRCLMVMLGTSKEGLFVVLGIRED